MSSAEHSGPLGWRPAVLVVDEEWSTLERVRSCLAAQYEVVTASRAGEAIKAMSARPFDVLLTDVRVPDMDGLSLVSELKGRYPETSYILMAAYSEIEDTIAAIRLGVADYLRKPFTRAEIQTTLSRCLGNRTSVRRPQVQPSEGVPSLADIITRNRRMRELLRLAQTVATTDATVLVSGESGTGKGLVARAIHNASPRRQKPFVEINCAAIPASLIESELFGHERGAFTGAVSRKIGLVETAHRGTLLLDEIGEMPLDMQSKLLSFLQEFSFQRVGGTQSRRADVRVVAATNRDLRKAVASGGFRLDLYYRLHVINLVLPPLRSRREDIPLLADYFLGCFTTKYGKSLEGLSPEARLQLLAHDWPGNVRELENAIERAVILAQGNRLVMLHLDQNLGEVARSAAGPALPPAAEPDTDLRLGDFLAGCERRYLQELLARHQGRVGESARAAGIDPKTLYRKMNRHGLCKDDYRTMARSGRPDGS